MSGRQQVHTPGVRHGVGEWLFDLATVECILAGPDLADVPVQVDAGARDGMTVALMRLPAGGEAEPRTLADDQWIVVLDGVLQAVVGGEDVEAGPGAFVLVPAGVAHSSRAAGERDVVFFIVTALAPGRDRVKGA